MSLIGYWFNLKEAQTKPVSGGFLVRAPALSTIATRWELVNKMKCEFNVTKTKQNKTKQSQCMEGKKQ